MEEIILNIIDSVGYLGVFLLIAIENIFPPIPSEVILLFSGFMTTYTTLNIPFIILFSTLGSLLGALILYFIGRLINREKLKNIVDGKIGKIIKLKSEDIDKASNWFDKKGNKAVFFCRFIPLVRSLISIPAGINKMNIMRFLFYTLIGSLIWNAILAILGNLVGDNWKIIADIVDKYSFIVLIFILIFSIISIIIFYKKRKGMVGKEKKM